MADMKIKELEQMIGYTFRDPQMLLTAMCHSSYANEHRQKQMHDNERLEFLGDAVLEIASSDFLFHQYPQMPEGKLTKLRASIVCEPTLALCVQGRFIWNIICCLEKARSTQAGVIAIRLYPMPWKH